VVGTAGSAAKSRSSWRRASRVTTSRRSPGYRRVLTAGDVALGAGIVATRPAVRASTNVVRQAGGVTMRVGAALFESLPQSRQSEIREQLAMLAGTGRQARVDSVDLLVGTVVAEAIASDVVRRAMTSAIEQALDEVVAAAMPSVIDELRSEVGPMRLDEMIRSSVERVVPEVIERDLSAALITAAALPGRTARGLARLPGSVLRSAALPEGSDE
jgi:hypothetical protein